jgi:hypothetical protein
MCVRAQSAKFGDVPLALGAKVRVLSEVPEHLAHLMGAREKPSYAVGGTTCSSCPCAFSVPTKSVKE